MDEEFSEDSVVQSRYGRTQFDYKQILLIHLRNMSTLITQRTFPSSQEPYTPTQMLQIMDESIENSFEWGVDVLEGLLSPYCIDNKKYQENLANLKAEAKHTNMLAKIFNKRKFALLIQLMHILNLLLEGEVGEKI
jgi:hypothetical protein